VIIIRCVGPLSSAVRGPFLGWLQPLVPSREACGPGRPYREAILDPTETCATRTSLGQGNCLSFEFLDATALEAIFQNLTPHER
jgi:hypothetical protein